MKDNTLRVVAHVPVDVGTYLLNEKRELLVGLEARHQIAVMLIPSPSLETPNYDVQRIRKDESISAPASASYQMAKAAPEPETTHTLHTEQPGPEVPAVKSVKPTAPAPIPAPASPPAVQATSKPGLWKRLFTSLFGSGEKTQQPAKTSKPAQQRGQQNRGRRGSTDRNRNRRKQPQGNRRPANRPAAGQSGDQRRQSGNRTQANRAQKKENPRQSTTAKPETTSAQPDQQATQQTSQQTSQQTTQQTKGEGTGQQKRGSRRGRRGGRRRSSGQNRDTSAQGTAASGNDAQTKPDADGNKKPSPADNKNQQRDAGNKGTQPAKQENRPSTPVTDKPATTNATQTPPQTKTAVTPAAAPQTAAGKPEPADGDKAVGSRKTEPGTEKVVRAESSGNTEPKSKKVASE
jgi:ribonuclease E